MIFINENEERAYKYDRSDSNKEQNVYLVTKDLEIEFEEQEGDVYHVKINNTDAGFIVKAFKYIFINLMKKMFLTDAERKKVAIEGGLKKKEKFNLVRGESDSITTYVGKEIKCHRQACRRQILAGDQIMLAKKTSNFVRYCKHCTTKVLEAEIAQK